jgi:hypothetical protein
VPLILPLLLASLAHAMILPLKLPHLTADCRVLDLMGALLQEFPGDHCVFLPDGGLISASQQGLRRFDHHDQLLWDVPGLFHHSVALSTDGKRVLVLGSETLGPTEKRLRHDIVLIYDLNGKELHRRSALPILAQAGRPALQWEMSPSHRELTKSSGEVSHFNSFYEIPPGAPLTPKLRGARYVVNGSGSGVFFLTEDLQELRHHFMADSRTHSAHDAQVTPTGRLLLFHNVNRTPNGVIYSAVREFDLATGRETLEITSNPKGLFFGRFAGGVQWLDADLTLFSDNLLGVYLHSRKRGLLGVHRYVHWRRGGTVIGVNRVRNEDLSAFLKARSARPALPSPRD